MAGNNDWYIRSQNYKVDLHLSSYTEPQWSALRMIGRGGDAVTRGHNRSIAVLVRKGDVDEKWEDGVRRRSITPQGKLNLDYHQKFKNLKPRY